MSKKTQPAELKIADVEIVYVWECPTCTVRTRERCETIKPGDVLDCVYCGKKCKAGDVQ